MSAAVADAQRQAEAATSTLEQAMQRGDETRIK